MDFTNQDGTLANLGDFHMGYGKQTGVEVTQGETVTAQATMAPLVAMAYFDIAGMARTGEPVYLYGDHINNQMIIDFSTNTPTYSQIDPDKTNFICVGTVASGSTSPVYVMLLPNHSDGTEELPTDITFVSKRTTGTCNNVFNYGIIGGRFYCKNGNTNNPIPVTVGSSFYGIELRGRFKVSDSKSVQFEQANLVYIKASSIMAILNKQYEVIETANQNVGTNYANQALVTLFGWGTSGYNNKYPYMTSVVTSNYGNGGSDIAGTNYDWGLYTHGNGWRTLTYDEWNYLLWGRTNESDKAGGGKVGDVYGAIFLPDEWSLPAGLSFTGKGNNNLYGPVNVYTIKQWEQMEANGAVFLPAAGRRYGEVVSYVNNLGYYWSSSNYIINDQTEYASCLQIDCWDINECGLFSSSCRWDFGCSVRLVKDVE